ncbi:MAG: signal peptide peptidase SppA [Kiritimatiellae bacterium]|nr:signal peptide peptidase SppA [Kiritimatiellia bacterium]MCO5068000.1 signal peptide peptidase SppA [Kiritimatiellia bacterium]
MNAATARALKDKLARPTKTHNHGVDEFPHFTEIWSYGEGSTKAVRIAVEGIIMREASSGFLSPRQNMVDSALAQIRAAQADDDVKAIIVDVDSPGGGITASDEIYRALMMFRSSAEGRVVIIFMRDLAASGGYYVSMAGDWIIAQPTTVVGSIGVIMQSINMKGLSEKIGISDVTIKSGANKDLLNPFNDVDPSQRELLQGMINNMYEHFLNIVQENRQIPMEELRPLADGRIFVADQALSLELVDQIGYWEDVMEKTKELLGVDSVKVIRYEQPVDFKKWLMSIRNPIQPANWLSQLRSRFLYLWQP